MNGKNTNFQIGKNGARKKEKNVNWNKMWVTNEWKTFNQGNVAKKTNKQTSIYHMHLRRFQALWREDTEVIRRFAFNTYIFNSQSCFVGIFECAILHIIFKYIERNHMYRFCISFGTDWIRNSEMWIDDRKTNRKRKTKSGKNKTLTARASK